MADITSATDKTGVAANTPSLGAYADVIRSHGAVSNGNKVIRLSEDAFKRLPIGAELSGNEPRGTIVLPTDTVTPNSSQARKLSGTVDYLGIEGTLVPEPYDYRRRAGGRNSGFIYGEGSWWRIEVKAGEVGCGGDPSQSIGVYYYWWAAGSTGNWWLIGVENWSTTCRLSDFDPVAVGAGTPPTPRPSPSPSPTPTPGADPDFALFLEGSEAQDQVITTVAPTFKVNLIGNPSDYDGPNSVTITFSKRSDGQDLSFSRDPESLIFKQETNTVEYKVPFSAETILYPGDQFVDVQVVNKQGKSVPVQPLRG